MESKNKILLLILDGVGVAPKSPGNAVTIAQPKQLIKLWETYPRTYLDAAGESVGLMDGTNGNSEVGHLTMGSGKINYQNLLKINNSIKKGDFFYNNTLKAMVDYAKKNKSKIHLMGCLSDGGVHSDIGHFVSTLEFLFRQNFSGEVLIHAFTDGRDSPQRAANEYLNFLEENMKKFKLGRIASICGRAYAMDRNNILERTKKAYELLTQGKGEHSHDWQSALSKAYQAGQNDEYMEPTLLFKNSVEESIIKDEDAVLFLNFRPDRALQLTRAFGKHPFFVGMVEYEKGVPQKTIFSKDYINLPLGRIISNAGYRQLRIAESEKYPHVTYFFNGGLPIQYPGEDRMNIPSPDVATYDLKPEMSAYEVYKKLAEILTGKNNYHFVVMNLANGDMVGHTGNLDASIKAIKVVDDIVGRVLKLSKKYDWTLMITADHGNIERMVEPETQEVTTEHSQNPVPLIIVNEQLRNFAKKQLRIGGLFDLSPTILKLMNIERPDGITGHSLI